LKDVTGCSSKPRLIIGHAEVQPIIHPNVYFGENVKIDITDLVTIEEGVIMADDVCIIRHTHELGCDRTLVSSRHPLVVRRGAFISERAIILEGCQHMGEWSVVGSGSVVTHSVPPCEVWVGVPARFLRKLDIPGEP
jgi:acetyltransferase-like isoleucine patch superfamily enzyme